MFFALYKKNTLHTSGGKLEKDVFDDIQKNTRCILQGARRLNKIIHAALLHRAALLKRTECHRSKAAEAPTTDRNKVPILLKLKQITPAEALET